MDSLTGFSASSVTTPNARASTSGVNFDEKHRVDRLDRRGHWQHRALSPRLIRDERCALASCATPTRQHSERLAALLALQQTRGQHAGVAEPEIQAESAEREHSVCSVSMRDAVKCRRITTQLSECSEKLKTIRVETRENKIHQNSKTHPMRATRGFT